MVTVIVHGKAIRKLLVHMCSESYVLQHIPKRMQKHIIVDEVRYNRSTLHDTIDRRSRALSRPAPSIKDRSRYIRGCNATPDECVTARNARI
jgi:hypothetical protein